MQKKARTTIIIPDSLMIDLKIMCALTHRRMGDFIRIAIKDKIRDLKNYHIDKNNDNDVVL